MLLLLVEPVPELDEPAAVTPANEVEADEVWPVGLDTAPAKDAEVVVVVAEDAVFGATVRGVPELVVLVVVVESFVWVIVVLSCEIIPAVELIEPDVEGTGEV
ncbi:hypothetical protein [Petrachloros mirabilis]